MTLQERIEALKERAQQYENLRSFGNAVQADIKLKQEIQSLYRTIFNKTVSGCSNCITDALFELLNCKNIMEKINLEYQLRAGALLLDIVKGDSKKTVSNANLTKDLALYHLATNPSCKRLFNKLPKDYQKEVKAFIQANRDVADFLGVKIKE
ncbi:MAG: hypothetical protein LBP85_07230 [Prevotellaceae bacterium]|jgi:predicted AAA+ superfamily ATPase|nr:hypothetical protein [Prevotellaceae bacterium]